MRRVFVLEQRKSLRFAGGEYSFLDIPLCGANIATADHEFTGV